MKSCLTFDDVLLVPQYGVLEKRENADISSRFVGDIKLDIPIISANMPSVTGRSLAAAMSQIGAGAMMHRFNGPRESAADFLGLNPQRVAASVGLHDYSDRVQALYRAGARIFCLDVAHGHHRQVEQALYILERQFADYMDVHIIAGNVATRSGFASLAYLGVSAVKVGIGPGAACRTREVTGFGVPQLSAIMDIVEYRDYHFPEVAIIADGGIKNSGDIVKALAAGADTVMIGSLLAGCNEAPLPGSYYGNASHRVNGHRAPEGVEGQVPRLGPVADVVKELAWGIKSGISYAGATNLQELRENAEWIQVSPGTQLESSVRV